MTIVTIRGFYYWAARIFSEDAPSGDILLDTNCSFVSSEEATEFAKLWKRASKKQKAMLLRLSGGRRCSGSC
jgi:hypothetical protein